MNIERRFRLTAGSMLATTLLVISIPPGSILFNVVLAVWVANLVCLGYLCGYRTGKRSKSKEFWF